MKRIDRIEQLIQKWTNEQFSMERVHPHEPQGCSAEWVSEQLGINRSNASRDLNALTANGKAVKIGGKPVLFLTSERFENLANLSYPFEFPSWRNFLQFLQNADSKQTPVGQGNHESVNSEVFTQLSGAKRSLKKQIELAKASILYPPNGLHTILTGPTGVGKTMFADCMYQFALETDQIKPNAPYVAFNCADYSNNPQLLLAQLFGVEKGAYTGADRDRAGIVEKADGGILLLDEVHRLPPEGQEMLFQLLDKGVYRRLGESDAQRAATIRLIAATTEDPKSSLLMTFTRRIPMLIPIPSLQQRSLDERFGLIQHFFSEESTRVQRPFWIAPEVLKALLLFDCPANVGQLKSEIQLLSARAFLAQIHDPSSKQLRVLLEHATDHVRHGLLQIPERRKDLDSLLEELPNGLFLNSDDNTIKSSDEESLYELLEHQAWELRKRGLSEEEINNVLSVDIDIYFRKFLQRVSERFESRRQDISRIVGESFLETIERMFDVASQKLERVFHSQTFFAVALHMHAAMERIRSGRTVQSTGVSTIRKWTEEEFGTAEAMAGLFEQQTGVSLPENEIGFLATILTTVNAAPSPRVGVLVIAHGTATATSMLEVTHQLLGTVHGAAIDMPLKTDPDQVLEQAVSIVKKLDEGKGILLLVDMGSLVSFGEMMQERTGVMVKVASNVTTLLVLEAVRKAALSSSTLESVYESVVQGFPSAAFKEPSYQPIRSGILPVVCVTGQGSAIQLKMILEERLQLPADYELNIVPVSISSFEETPERLEKLLGGSRPLAVVGTINPQLDGVPFISAQEVINGQGLWRIAHLVEASLVPIQRLEEAGNVWDSLLLTLRETLKRANPYYILPVLLRAISKLEKDLCMGLDGDSRIGIVLHLIMSIEKKLLTGQWPAAEQVNLPSAHESREWETVSKAVKDIGAEIGLEIPAAEGYHLLRLIRQNHHFTSQS